MSRKVIVLALALFVCTPAASLSEPPSKTIVRLRAQNRAQHNLIVALFAKLNQLQSDLTDCVNRLPPPTEP